MLDILVLPKEHIKDEIASLHKTIDELTNLDNLIITTDFDRKGRPKKICLELTYESAT